jgi:hypothetical protein
MPFIRNFLLLKLLKLLNLNVMKKLLLSAFLVSAFEANTQITIFENSFKTYPNFAIANIGAWTVTDLDGLPTYGIEQETPPVSVVFDNAGDPLAFMVMNASAAVEPLTPAAWGGKTGAKCMAAMASIPAPPNNTNNDYLISPVVALGTSGNTLKFWAKGISTQYPEKFRVGVSTTGILPTNFTMITSTAGVTPPTVWTEYTYSLDAYAGQNVRITIQCVSDDAFALLIDDFKVTATVLETSDFFNTNFSVYPNPVSDVINISNVNKLELTTATITDVNGRIVKQVNSVLESINISELNSGIYFLKIKTTQGEGVTKFIKN